MLWKKSFKSIFSSKYSFFFSYFNANQFDEYDVIYNQYVNLLQTR